MSQLSLSGVLAGDSLKSMKFGLSAMTELLSKCILLRAWKLALSSGTVLRSITLLKMGIGCPCSRENRLMEVLNGWAFLNFRPMDPLILTISCVPVCGGETEVLLKIGLEESTWRSLRQCWRPEMWSRPCPYGLPPSESGKRARHCTPCSWQSPSVAPPDACPKSLGF